MPHSPIRALAQTRDGYLWLGSDDGLARFDGVRFANFDAQGFLRGNPVRALFGDSQGALWIGTGGGGLMRYQNGRFTTFKMRDGLPADSILSLAEDRDGRLWVGTEAGLAVWQQERFAPLNGDGPFKGRPITTLFRDPDGNLWLGATGAGVFEFRSGAFVPLIDPAVEELLKDPLCLLVDQSRRLWIGAGDDLVLCRDHDQWRRYRIPRHTARPCVKALVEESDGTVWAGSVSEGLFQFKGDKLTAINAGSGLSDNLIESLLMDRKGKLWVGTDTALNRLQHKNLFVFGQEEGLSFGAVLGLAEVAPGVVWAARPNDGLYRWEGNQFSRLTAAGLPLRDPQVNALLVTRDGGCWVACARGLLRFKDPQAVADESVLAGLSGLDVTSLAEDSEGRIWAGTRDGALWRLARGNWKKLTNFPETHAVTAIAPDADGALWIGTDGGGLYRFRNEAFAHYQKGNGLLNGSIRTLTLDGSNTLWIGTAGGGLSRWRDGRITTFTTRDGLPENTISQILIDDAGRVWLGGNRGIACVNAQELDKLASGKTAVVYPQVYGRAEGMLSEECTGGFFPAGLKTRSGLLWFSTTRGVVVADPHHHATAPSTPTVVLEEVLVDEVPATGFKALAPVDENAGGVRPSVETLRIPPGRHRLQLQYTGLNSDAPEQMRFRYRLEGWDTDWLEAGTRRTAFYNYVPPGNYRFRVITCDSDGVWNNAGTSLDVTVSRYFWQAWWVIGLGSLGLLVSVGASVRLVEKRKLHRRLRRLEQERALERERTRIAQDLHDEMGAKLCRISFLSEHARRGDNMPAELRHQIASISDASREVLHSLDEIVWAVNPQNDTLEHVASYIGHYAEEYFQMTGIACELDIPAELPAHPLSSQVRHHLFLAVHEAFTNILKHSGATRSKVAMACNGSTFEISASDNGNGFDPHANEPRPRGPAAEPGDGLHNMRQRLADIGGHCYVESGPKQGTTIRFVVPLKRQPAKGET
jgi:ligand-binding sensor domain-containing protein/signal transduction histidine kinase